VRATEFHLLQLVEAVDLVDEEERAPPAGGVRPGAGDGLLDLGHAAADGRQRHPCVAVRPWGTPRLFTRYSCHGGSLNINAVVIRSLHLHQRQDHGLVEPHRRQALASVLRCLLSYSIKLLCVCLLKAAQRAS
jgi:hypothetical protein